MTSATVLESPAEILGCSGGSRGCPAAQRATESGATEHSAGWLQAPVMLSLEGGQTRCLADHAHHDPKVCCTWSSWESGRPLLPVLEHGDDLGLVEPRLSVDSSSGRRERVQLPLYSIGASLCIPSGTDPW